MLPQPRFGEVSLTQDHELPLFLPHPRLASQYSSFLPTDYEPTDSSNQEFYLMQQKSILKDTNTERITLANPLAASLPNIQVNTKRLAEI